MVLFDPEQSGRRAEPRELARCHAARAGGDLERRWARRRECCPRGTSCRRPCGARAPASTRAVARRRSGARRRSRRSGQAHPPRRQEVAMHDALEVRAKLVRARELVEPRVRTDAVDRVVTERHRIDAVERRRLMQPDERDASSQWPPGACRRSTMVTVASECVRSASVNAIPAAPAPTTR